MAIYELRYCKFRFCSLAIQKCSICVRGTTKLVVAKHLIEPTRYCEMILEQIGATFASNKG